MGIKNFQGARTPQSKENMSLKVSDYMTTNLITFTRREKNIDSSSQ